MIGIALALIVVCFAAMVAMVYSQGNTVRRIEETQLRQIGADTTAQKMIDKRIDNIITVHNSAIDHYDQQIDEIIKKMEKITEDIKRLDTELKYQQAKMNVVYPWFENLEYNSKSAGVSWAKDFPDQEVEHD